jgi:hypothetical protein
MLYQEKSGNPGPELVLISGLSATDLRRPQIRRRFVEDGERQRPAGGVAALWSSHPPQEK